jgi:hypothetical protein
VSRVAATLPEPVNSVMSPIRHTANDGPERDRPRSGVFGRLRLPRRAQVRPGLPARRGAAWGYGPEAGLVVWTAVATGLAGLALAGLGIRAGSLATALAGAVLAAVSLGLATGSAWTARRSDAGRAPAQYTGLRSLGAAVGLVVGVFALTVTAANVGVEEGATLIRLMGLPALALSFGALGFALTMGQDARGRRRPDWVFVGLATMLIALTVWQLYDRLGLIFFV